MSNPLDLLRDADLDLPSSPRGPRIAMLVVGVLALLLVAWLVIPSRSLPADCGDLAAEDDDDAASPVHDQICTAEAEVADDRVVALGSEDPRAKTPAERLRSVRLFALAKGARVVLVFPGADEAVQAWMRGKGSLKGFKVAQRGRFFDPDQQKGYAPLARPIRDGLGLGTEPYLIFDRDLTR